MLPVDGRGVRGVRGRRAGAALDRGGGPVRARDRAGRRRTEVGPRSGGRLPGLVAGRGLRPARAPPAARAAPAGQGAHGPLRAHDAQLPVRLRPRPRRLAGAECGDRGRVAHPQGVLARRGRGGGRLRPGRPWTSSHTRAELHAGALKSAETAVLGQFRPKSALWCLGIESRGPNPRETAREDASDGQKADSMSFLQAWRPAPAPIPAAQGCP